LVRNVQFGLLGLLVGSDSATGAEASAPRRARTAPAGPVGAPGGVARRCLRAT